MNPKRRHWSFNPTVLPVITAIIISSLVLQMIEAKAIHCDFNQLCLCQNYSAQYIDVTCVNVPLVSVPNFGPHYSHLYRIRLIGVPELTQLQENDFKNLITLASLSISKSRLSYVNPDTFRKVAIQHTLTTLDLSYGNLIEIPVNALTHLHQLQWLSLKGNQIELIRVKELKELKALRTLLLNENSLSIVEDRTFHKLPSLELIDFDGNSIERVEGSPFPSTLQSLSLSNCLLRKIPFSAIENLPNLRVLQLHGNLISHLSPFKLLVTKMESINLSHNLISNLPNNLFVHFSRLGSPAVADNKQQLNQQQPEQNKSVSERRQISTKSNHSHLPLQIERFHLDFNFIQSLPADLFSSILIEKLTLSSNRISSQLISPRAFAGPLESNLEVLDLNYNLIDSYPEALKTLSALKQLLLKNNRIKVIDPDSFRRCSQTLEALDLSQNLLETIPSTALSVVKNLIKINLHDNLITAVGSDDFDAWCQELRSLTLSKNSLVTIGSQTFRSCHKLSEVRLGGNKLLQLTSNTLSHHLRSVQLLDLSSLNDVNPLLDESRPATDNVQTLPQVKWLQFDFNFLRTIPQRLIHLFPSLMYFDLQHNLISQLPDNLREIKNLTTIILSHNNLTSIESKAFVGQPKLESIAVYFNRIRQIKKFAFDSLPRLQSLVLSKNQIRHIEPDAFYNLSRQSKALTLMLDENELHCLSANSFRQIVTENSTTDLSDLSVYLNVSHNQIKTLNCPAAAAVASEHNQQWQTLPIRVLDLSFNQISSLTASFLNSFCGQCLSLFVNNNAITSLPVHLFRHCPRLQTLSINFNRIGNVEGANSDSHSTSLINQTLQIQTLSLRSNQISQLTEFKDFFAQLAHLKSLDLAENRITEIPANAFQRTSLVKLNLAHNRLRLQSTNEDDQCFGIKDSLKYIDISYNSLTSLPARIVLCANLIELLASNNQIHSFQYLTPLWHALPSLHRLELFNNPIQTKDGRVSLHFLNNHSMLANLNINNLNIVHLEELNVPYLTTLDISHNEITTINSKMLSRSRNIRYLNLAFNKLTEVPKHIWKYVTRLRYLDLQDNPIDILDSSSFAGLKYLKYLDIRGLKLQYIDSRIFLYQSQLSKLKISTYPQIRSFRLQDILAKSDALKTAVIDVKESILSHQIQWAFGGKLRELIITGQNLITILPDSFQGLNNANDLTLRIINTSIRHLPDGLLRYLADIRYITIDLTNNQLETVSPNVFFNHFTDKNPVKSWQSRQLLGGIILEDNPLVCDCNLLWISRWMNEIFTEMKSINIEAAIHVKAALSLSRCRLWDGMGKIPITHLREEDIGQECHEEQSINSARSVTFLPALIGLFLCRIFTL